MHTLASSLIGAAMVVLPVLACSSGPAAATGVRAATGQLCTVVGTAGNDRLVGTHGYDVICGRGGADVLTGRGGDDVLDGGDGNDVLDGSDGDDVAAGGAGNDVVRGGAGRDRVQGGAGHDTMNGGDANDVLDGGDGNDVLGGGGGNDVLGGGGGNDSAAGDAGNDRLSGGTGDDRLTGGPGSDHLDGGTGVNRCVRDAADTSPRAACTDLAKPSVDLASAQWVGSAALDNSVARTVEMRMRLRDDRSGVKTAAMYMSSPAGTTLEFARPRLVSGTVNDGIWLFRASLPAAAPVGLWSVYDFGVWDRVGHVTGLEAPTGLPTLTVTGTADEAAPVVDVSSAKWVTASVLDNSVARTVEMQVRLTDDRSGVRSATMLLTNDAGTSLEFAVPRLVSGTVRDGVWSFKATLPAFAPVGEWSVSDFSVRDRAGRTASLAAPTGLPALSVTAGG